MSATTVKFNVGGTVFQVAVSTIQSQPEGLLAKMIDGRFKCGKDEGGAFFVDRSPRFFDIVLDVHRDNKVHPLTPEFTRERVLEELEFYGLQDFSEGAPIELSAKSTFQSMQDFAQWQQKQKLLGSNMLTEGFARLCLANTTLDKEVSPATFRIPPIQLATFTKHPNMVHPLMNAEIGSQIVKLFADWGMEATLLPEKGGGPGGLRVNSTLKLKPANPDAGA